MGAVEQPALSPQNITDFYANKTVLVTGCTGFVGKVLLEKVLWEICSPAFEGTAGAYAGPVIKLLIRSSRQASAQERLEDLIMKSPAFDRLRERHGLKHFGGFLRQCVEVVDADLELDGFGLGSSHYQQLCREIDVIIHCAALVAWGAPLDASLRANAAGSKRVAQLAHDSRLASKRAVRLVLVSTAWVHGMRKGRCPETPISQLCDEGTGAAAFPPLDPHAEMENSLAKAEQLQQDSLSASYLEECQKEAVRRLGPSAEPSSLKAAADEIRARRVEAQMVEWGLQRARHFGWWDGYTFSKAIAERFVQELQGPVPYAVVRPSGVVAASREPTPGWVDAYLLVEPLIEGVGRGQIKSFPGDPSCIIDCVPVDFVCSVILVAAAKLPCEPCAAKDATHVYQCASGDVYPNRLGDIEATWRDYFRHTPMYDAHGKAVEVQPVEFAPDADTFSGSLRRRYSGPLQACIRALELVPFWDRMAPTRNARGWLEKKRRGIEKVLGLAKLYSTYTINEWNFETRNSRSLMADLTDADKQRFPYFPTQSWDWASFWSQKHIPGMRQWVLKEAVPVNQQPIAKL